MQTLYEEWLQKNTYEDGRKVWYADTLIKAAKGLPVKSMPINNKLLDTKIHWQLKTFFDLKSHMDRMNKAELKYPVIVGPKDHIVDGYHRLMKAIQLNKTSIKYVKLDKMPPHDFIKGH